MKLISVWRQRSTGTVEWYFEDGVLVVDLPAEKLMWFNDPQLSIQHSNGRRTVQDKWEKLA